MPGALVQRPQAAVYEHRLADLLRAHLITAVLLLGQAPFLKYGELRPHLAPPTARNSPVIAATRLLVDSGILFTHFR